MATVSTHRTHLTVALIGNPNTGKSTLFSALSGFQAQTGNYPGVTVEKKIGKMRLGDRMVHLVDLPGTYSLSPRSPDEMVAVDVLLGRQKDVGTPDLVICIVDASNLERNLYLVSQVLDIGLPVILVLNMTDVAVTRGIVVDVPALSQRLGVPVIGTEAHRKRGLAELRQAIQTAGDRSPPDRLQLFPQEFQDECRQLGEQLAQHSSTAFPEYLVERLLLDVGGHIETHLLNGDTTQALRAARDRLADNGCKVPAIEARVRYRWAREMLDGVLVRPTARPVTFSDRVDRILTHRFAGLLIFAALMFVIFQSIYSWSEPLVGFCEAAQGQVSTWIGDLVPAGPLQSLLIDGVVAGVGGVLVFLPQIVILFLFIAALEDCGYMARAAFLMDKLMTKVGLSGKSFVPLMSSFACAIPGVMATRVIENRRDRMTTILVAPLMSCSARQPVYLLLIAGFIPAISYTNGWVSLQGLTLFGMTCLGAVVAIPIAWLLKKTLFRGETPPFVMELPSYKWPSLRMVLSRVYSQAKEFVVRAGTLIFATTVVIWALGYFPGDHREADRVQTRIQDLSAKFEKPLAELDRLQAEHDQLEAQLAELAAAADKDAQTEAVAALQTRLNETDEQLARVTEELQPLDQQVEHQNVLNAALLENSYLGRMGHAFEPAFKPLGWDWKIGVAVLASFPAREVIIAALGTIYSLGSDVDAENQGLRSALQSSTWPDGKPVFTVPVALSIMVFFALCAQCASTLMVIKRETNSWWWPVFTFVYMTGLAYVMALATFQVASLMLG